MNIVFGLMFAAIGAWFVVRSIMQKVNCTESTIGRVTDISIERNRDSDGHISVMKYPIFEYDVNGEHFIEKSRVGSNTTKYRIGQEVEIFYDPNKNDNFYVSGEHATSIMGIIFFIMGMAVVILPFFANN